MKFTEQSAGIFAEHLKGLYGNQLFERMLLLFTEQAAYPPNHYVRYVPQKQIHIFTLCQTVQLLILGKRQNSWLHFISRYFNLSRRIEVGDGFNHFCHHHHLPE